MPVYEYGCMRCNEKFAVLQKMTSEKNETKCPKCGTDEVKKMISSFCCSSGSGQSFQSSGFSGGFSGGG